ncbi:MAG: major capsid protein [Microvirus sp.]|nr:MAG: major capsid protein [Microvirus sp.]
MKKNLLNSIKISTPSSNVFDLTHDVKMTGNFGYLMPVLALECLPGDKIHIGADTLIRFAPLIAPVMHRMDATIHYFFVPNRIVWDGWEEFITNHNSDRVMPIIKSAEALTADQKKFLDYMGIPPCTTVGQSADINAIPFAAYLKIYNDYYRDQNLITDLKDQCQLIDGDNSANLELFKMRNRAWEHDYFTASLPFAQKGASVDIPLGDVMLKPGTEWNFNPRFEDLNQQLTATTAIQTDSAGNIFNTPVGNALAYNPMGTMTTEPTTINDLRRAFKLQEWLEKNARGGTRYVESILVHFGVRSSDARLQRPEYITGVKSPVIISEVLNTTGIDLNATSQGGGPQGNMAGHGIAVTTGKSGSKFCEEHGYIIGIMSVMPKSAYQNGIPKTFLKRDSMDIYWPEFAHLGEQEVQNQEIFAYTASPKGIFGYLPRYTEYKYMPSRIAGDFRTTLNYWHIGRIFNTPPALNQNFIECFPQDVARIFAVTDPDADPLYIQILHRIKAVRRMPVFGTPSF